MILSAFHIFRARPGFAALVIAALGLGIGANTALFTVINSLVFRPLPYERPETLVDISSGQRTIPWDEVHAMRSIDGAAAFLAWGFSVGGQDGARNLYGFKTTANLFDVLGVKEAIGRTLAPGDEDQRVVVLT